MEKEEVQNNILYKYRGVGNFEYLLDIIINNRLYAGSYKSLNDISEAHYIHDYDFPKDTIEKILGEKSRYGICSLSKRCDNSALWAHYADSHQGVVIALEIKESKNIKKIDVEYGGVAIITSNSTVDKSTLVEILKKKKQDWSYEEEVRILTYNKKYIDIEIREIILGSRISDSHKMLIKKKVNKLNPQIKIIPEEMKSHNVT